MNWIKKLRRAKGWTQRELADAVGLAMDTISRYERGDREPRASDIKKLSAALGVKEDELLNGPSEVFCINLKYEATLKGVSDVMSMNGITLTVSDDGFVGVSGGKKFESKDDVDAVAEEIRRKLHVGFETREMLRQRQEG